MTMITVTVLLPFYRILFGPPCSTAVSKCICLYYTNPLTISQLEDSILRQLYSITVHALLFYYTQRGQYHSSLVNEVSKLTQSL